MKKAMDKKRGWLISLVVLCLMIVTPFHDLHTALASDFVEEEQMSSVESELLERNSAEWHTEVRASQQNAAVVQNDSVPEEITEVENPLSQEPVEEESTKAPVTVTPIKKKQKSVQPNWRIRINVQQLELLERCVMSEGGGESYKCQVAIACVIINRVLSDKYPDTVEEVIKQPGQFSTWPTMIENVTVSDQVKQAVREALTEGTLPENVLYFRANRYHRWGNRYCRIDDTYFSTP